MFVFWASLRQMVFASKKVLWSGGCATFCLCFQVCPQTVYCNEASSAFFQKCSPMVVYICLPIFLARFPNFFYIYWSLSYGSSLVHMVIVSEQVSGRFINCRTVEYFMLLQNGHAAYSQRKQYTIHLHSAEKDQSCRRCGDILWAYSSTVHSFLASASNAQSLKTNLKIEEPKVPKLLRSALNIDLADDRYQSWHHFVPGAPGWRS